MPKAKKQRTRHHYQQNHRNSVVADPNLSHEEIWDDSALLRSWNDALKEYEFYHSIHACGQDIEEILRQAEKAEPHDQNQDQDQIQDPKDSTSRPDIDNGPGQSSDEGEINDPLTETDQVHSSTQVRTLNHQTAPMSRVKVSTTTAPMRTNGVLETSDHGPLNGIFASISEGLDYEDAVTEPAPVPSDGNPVNGMIREGGPEVDPVECQVEDQTLENIKMAYYWAGYYSGLYDGQRQRQKGESGMEKKPG